MTSGHAGRRIGAAMIVLAVWVACGTAAFGARPLLDQHQWDAYFALFARDVYVPWKPTSIRLDTYSGAAVDFAAYEVDPADVIVAGQNRTPRPLDTSHRKAVVRWRFSPPAGYRFESNDVAVPLGSREGFFVIEARRGDAVQQVWINRSHLGLLTKESPEGIVLWAVDLRTGHALAHLDVSFLAGLRLIGERTDADGIIVWRERERPTFALAQDGAARAFVSLVPQAPPPQAVVSVRLDSAVARSGERIRFVGFARRKQGAVLRASGGQGRVSLLGRGATLASAPVALDASGAFWGDVLVPATTPAGDYAVLANVNGTVGGTSVHVDAASDVALSVSSDCPCDPARDVAFAVGARRGEAAAAGVPVRVQIVRTPHLVPPGSPDDAPRWGTTVVYDRTLHTEADGFAHGTLASPSDGLDSTYGVRVSARGASATARIVVPNADVALAIAPDSPSADVGEPVAFDVRGFDASDGTPATGASVHVTLAHGVASQEQTVTLDARGMARATFAHTNLGTNLAFAQLTTGGRKALDVAQVTVEPSALSGRTQSTANAVVVNVDKTRYRPGDSIAVAAAQPGAAGDALVTLEGAKTYAVRRVTMSDGRARASFPVGDPQGTVRVAAAMVRDGALGVGSAAVNLDAPGHVRLTEIALDKASYAPGSLATLTIRDGDLRGAATLALRVAAGRESGSALFEDAPDVLASAATSSQAPASADPEWHAYVAPVRSKASDIFAAERPRKVPTEIPSIGAAAPRTLVWRVAPVDGDTVTFTVPVAKGRFIVSILKIARDGDVGAASAGFGVQ